jgi:hypothetical protein
MGRGHYRNGELTVRTGDCASDPLTLVRERITSSAELAVELGLGELPKNLIPLESAHAARPTALIPRDPRRPDGYLLRRDDGSFGRVEGRDDVAHPVPKTQRRELALLLTLRDTYVTGR